MVSRMDEDGMFSSEERAIVVNRLDQAMSWIEKLPTEERRLATIRQVIELTISELHNRHLYRKLPVTPSILPEPDSKTREFVADNAIRMHEKGSPPAVIALAMEHMEHMALQVQREVRN